MKYRSNNSDSPKSSFNLLSEYEKAFVTKGILEQGKSEKLSSILLSIFVYVLLLLIVASILLSIFYHFVPHDMSSISEPVSHVFQEESSDQNSSLDNATEGEYYIVTVGHYNRLSLRLAPSDDSEKLDRIENGTRLLITEVQGNWGQTTYNGQTGWVCIQNSEDGDVYLQKE